MQTDDQAFTPPQLAAIRARTLIVTGDRDPLYPLELFVEQYRAIPDAALCVIPHGGHDAISAPRAPTSFGRRSLSRRVTVAWKDVHVRYGWTAIGQVGIRAPARLGARTPPWLDVAAHIDGDDELKARLANHRRDHDTTWKLIQAPEKLITALDPAMLADCGAAVIDRFTVWLSRRLAAMEKSGDGDLLSEVEALADRLYRSPTPAVVVTTEIGLGFLPANVPDCRLINIAGKANQILSERAESVVLMVSGVPLRLR